MHLELASLVMAGQELGRCGRPYALTRCPTLHPYFAAHGVSWLAGAGLGGPHRLGLVLEWVYGTIVSTAEKARDGAKRSLGKPGTELHPPCLPRLAQRELYGWLAAMLRPNACLQTPVAPHRCTAYKGSGDGHATLPCCTQLRAPVQDLQTEPMTALLI